MAIDDVETSQDFFHAFVACSTAVRLGSSSMLSYFKKKNQLYNGGRKPETIIALACSLPTTLIQCNKIHYSGDALVPPPAKSMLLSTTRLLSAAIIISRLAIPPCYNLNENEQHTSNNAISTSVHSLTRFTLGIHL